MIRRSWVAAALLATALIAATAQPAHGSRYLRIGLYDEAQTLYGPIDETMPTLKALHVQELRLNLYWGARYGVAKRRPAHATNPSDPAYDWSLYDRVVRYANEYGMHVLFSIYGTPGWANGGLGPNHAPKNANDLRNFAFAAAKRYGGQFPDGQGGMLPPVREWLAWNEPNNPLFLAPQYKGKVIQSAIDYTKICNAVYNGVHGTLYGGERVACGVTGPRGQQQPEEQPALGLAPRVPSRGQEGRPEAVRRLGSPSVLRQPDRHTDDEAGRSARRASDRGHTRQLQRPEQAADPALWEQAHLDHRVRLPDQPARSADRRLVGEAGGVSHPGLRDSRARARAST